MKKNSGFTLIECLIALMIMAIVLASASRTIGLAINNIKESYLRELSMWVADNTMNEYYLGGVYPNIGKTQNKVTMAGVNFIVSTDIEATPNQYFRKIIIAVAEADKPTYFIFTNTSFKSQY